MDAAHRNSLQPGHLVHWYKIEKILGQGGFGITYLAVDTNLNQRVAIKEYLPIELAVRDSNNSLYPISNDRSHQYSWGLERFIAEAQTLAKFDHHNIVRVLTVFDANNTAYMVMRYEEGDSLQDILKAKKTLDEKTLKKILFPILDGLEKVHAEGFIHRDIKPANIYIRNNGSPVLLDFGAARQSLGEETKTLTSMVSSGYAPFEQYFSKSDQQGPWTDIYGLGATMYRAITSKLPMDAVDRSNSILQISEDTLVSASDIGRGSYTENFLKSVDHALQFKYQNRPQSITEWIKELNSQTINTEQKSVIKKKQEDISTKIAEPQVNAANKKNKLNRSSFLNFGIASIIIIVLVSSFYIYNNPDILTAKKQSEEKILSAQEELEMRREELVLLEEKAKQEKAREEELVRLKEERKRKIAEEKARKKKEVEDKEKQINLLLTKADEDIEANRLVYPKGNNAYAKYRKILELSLEHTKANEGIEKIGGIFVSEAQVAIENRDYKRASKLLAEANKIIPDSENLKEQKKILSVAIEKVRVNEEKRIAVENARKIKEEKQKKIKALLIVADSNIKAKRLISPEDNNAFINYKKILEVSPKHTAANDGMLNISNLIVSELQAEINKSNFSEADNRLKEAIKYFPNSNNIKEVQQALILAKLEAKKEKARLAEEKRLADEKARKRLEEKQLQIKNLLAQAKVDINEERFVEPKDGNALETYQQVLELSPAHAGAEQGIINVANALVVKAKNEIVKNNFVEAVSLLKDADSITPDSKEIIQTYSLLDEEKLKIRKDKAKNILFQVNEAVDKHEFERAKALLGEAKLLDPGSKKIQISQKRYEEGYSKKLEEQKRAREVKRLLAAGKINLKENKLTEPKGNNAFAQFNKVLEFEPSNEEATSGIRKIFNSYLELAEKANKAEEYQKSQGYINKANKIIPNEQVAIAMIEELKPKLVEIEALKIKEAEKQAELERLAKEAELIQQAEQEQLEKKLKEKRIAEERQQAEIAEQEVKKPKNLKAGTFIKIPSGAFNMSGKTVNIESFEMGKYEITQAQWRDVMGSNPSFLKNCDNCPVENVKWSDAQGFIQKLNAESEMNYRLPTAAEWEYACYLGGGEEQCKGRNLEAISAKTFSATLSSVGSKQSDKMGLYNMTSNAWEWTCSAYSIDNNGNELVCEDINKKTVGAIRGGKKIVIDPSAFSFYSRENFPSMHLNNVGFRLIKKEGLVKSVKSKFFEKEKQRNEIAKETSLIRLTEDSTKLTKTTKAGEFVKIPGGTLNIGGKSVNVEAFEMGKYEVTKAQWLDVMGNDPSFVKDCGEKCPVENVRWREVQAFIQKLNASTGLSYRLPTVVEWEYACVKGGNNKNCKGSNIDAIVAMNRGAEKIYPVGQESPNKFGLYNMADNAWEWTCSAYSARYNGNELVCEDANKKSTYAVRGGKKYNFDANYASTLGVWNNHDMRFLHLGFRLVTNQVTSSSSN